VQSVFPSDANFLLVKINEPEKVYDELVEKGIIVRDRSRVELCEGCLRITVGTPGENDALIQAIRKLEG
ncbi:MAG: aminotransferase class I/II-fold pyridoxal phosphate-dependent enzyme, partial [Chitinophagaceae bacterium]